LFFFALSPSRLKQKRKRFVYDVGGNQCRHSRRELKKGEKIERHDKLVNANPKLLAVAIHDKIEEEKQAFVPNIMGSWMCPQKPNAIMIPLQQAPRLSLMGMLAKNLLTDQKEKKRTRNSFQTDIASVEEGSVVRKQKAKSRVMCKRQAQKMQWFRPGQRLVGVQNDCVRPRKGY
jgi:hypothetical protein